MKSPCILHAYSTDRFGDLVSWQSAKVYEVILLVSTVANAGSLFGLSSTDMKALICGGIEADLFISSAILK